MKADIHPQYEPIKATCSCGNVIETSSTLCADLQIEVCSKCHPFYTGKQKILDSGGRVERFRRRFGNRKVGGAGAAEAAEAGAAEAAEAAAEESDSGDEQVEAAVQEDTSATDTQLYAAAGV